MSSHTMSDRALVAAFILSVLTYGFGDVLSTYIALSYDHNSSEGMPVSAGLISGGLGGYALLLALKLIGLMAILGMAFFGWRIVAKWSLLGFAIYGSYLTASNITVSLTGYPLLPPGDQQFISGFIWMAVLPFLAIGFILETMDTINILKGEKEGYGVWGQRVKILKDRRSRKGTTKNR